MSFVAAQLLTPGPEWTIKTYGTDLTQAIIGSTSTLGGPSDFDSATDLVSINDSRVVTFVGLTGGSTIISLFAGIERPPKDIADFAFGTIIRPLISNTNEIVFRDDHDEIVLLPITVNSSTGGVIPGAKLVISDSSTASVGASPGVSKDGLAVSLFARPAGGDGIYLAVRSSLSSPFQLVRVAGSKDGFDFSGFEDSRVGVTDALIPGPVPATQPTQIQIATLVFAAKFGGLPGVYRARVTVTPKGVSVSTPTLVAQAGDIVGGKTISSLFLYDPISSYGVAFFAVFDDLTTGVVRRKAPCGAASFSAKDFDLKQSHDAGGADSNPWYNLPYATGYFCDAKNGFGCTKAQAGKPCPNGGTCIAKTIGKVGCELTAAVNIINYHAFKQGLTFRTNPGLLNAYLNTQRDGYDVNGIFQGMAVERYANQKKNGVKVKFIGGLGNNRALLDSLLSTGNPVILRVKNHGHTVVSYGEADSVDGTETFEDNDPAYSPQHPFIVRDQMTKRIVANSIFTDPNPTTFLLWDTYNRIDTKLPFQDARTYMSTVAEPQVGQVDTQRNSAAALGSGNGSFS